MDEYITRPEYDERQKRLDDENRRQNHRLDKLEQISNQIADIADKFTRNEILSSNELRQIIGFKPSNQEGADDLRNKNLNQKVEPQQTPPNEVDDESNQDEVGGNQNGV